MLALAPQLDEWSSLRLWFARSPQPVVGIGSIVVSCATAILINWSTARVLAISTPVTYLILGHCKTCANILVGYVLFDGRVEARNVAGVVLALFGLLAYGYARCCATSR